MYDSCTNLERAKNEALMITVRNHSVIDDFCSQTEFKNLPGL